MKKTGEEKQIEILRRMSGGQRVRIGCQLYDLSLKIASDGIRSQFPGISQEDLEEKLKERLSK